MGDTWRPLCFWTLLGIANKSCHVLFSSRYLLNQIAKPVFRLITVREGTWVKPHFMRGFGQRSMPRDLLIWQSPQVHGAVPVGQAFWTIDLLPAPFHDTITGLVHSADFRSLASLDDQMHFLKQHTKLPLEMIGTLVDRSKSKVHRHLTAKSTEGGSGATVEPKKAKRLTSKDKERASEWIAKRQRQQNCASPAEARESAFSLRSEARGETIVGGEHMSHDWWRSFRKTYEQRIGIKVATSREHARTRCKDVDVRESSL